MSMLFPIHRGLRRAVVAAGALAAALALASAAAAGECPADKFKADARAPVSTPATGVTDTVLATIDLAKEPVKLNDQTISILGRNATLAAGGLLGSIATTFTPSVDRADGPPRPILAAPMRLVVERPDGPPAWKAGLPRIVSQASGAVAWEASSKSGNLDLIISDGRYQTVQGPRADSALVTVFENGEIRQRWTFDEVRARAEAVLL